MNAKIKMLNTIDVYLLQNKVLNDLIYSKGSFSSCKGPQAVLTIVLSKERQKKK